MVLTTYPTSQHPPTASQLVFSWLSSAPVPVNAWGWEAMRKQRLVQEDIDLGTLINELCIVIGFCFLITLYCIFSIGFHFLVSNAWFMLELQDSPTLIYESICLFTHLITHSLIHLLTLPFIHSFIHLFVLCPSHPSGYLSSVICWFIHLFIQFFSSSIHPLTHLPTHSLNYLPIIHSLFIYPLFRHCWHSGRRLLRVALEKQRCAYLQ
jgi:hypothetical protein